MRGARSAAALFAAAAALAQDPPPSAGDFRIGNRFVLKPCSPTDNDMGFYVTSSTEGNPGQIWFVGSQNSNWHVAMSTGGSTGFLPELFLSPTIPGNPFERWTEQNRSLADGTTGIDNDFVDHRCWQWSVANNQLVAGAAVRPSLCSAGTSGALFRCDSPSAGRIEAIFANGSGSNLCVAPDAAITPEYSLPADNVDVVYDGMGVIAGEGAARLLADYDPAVSARVLDLLFLPGLLASLDIVKIEIGGDGNVIQGSTPAHRHSLGETPNFARGSQTWLAAQAKARNPQLMVVALAWSFPGFLVSNGSPFGDCAGSGPCLAATYVAEWVGGVRSALGLVVDVVGTLSDFWDAANEPSFVKALRARLDAAGLTAVRIVCGEDGTWACAEAALADADLAAAVGIFSTHGSSRPSAAAAALGKRLWATHRSSLGEAANLRGAAILGVALAADAAAGFSATMVWGALCAAYDGTPEHNNGLVRADSPTSGFFAVTPSLFAVAHTSRFARPGWLSLDPAKTTGSGALARGGTYRLRYSSGGISWALTICKFRTGGNDAANNAVSPELATFQLASALYPSGPATAYVYVTAYGAAGNRNASFMQSTQNISIVGGHFTLYLDTNTHVTVTNVAPSAPLPVLTPPAVPAAFPATFSSDAAWAAAAPGQTPPFLSDVSGAFEIVPDPVAGGLAAQQMTLARPFTRYGTDTAPHALLGDQAWRDVSASVEVFLRSAADSALFGVRCSGLHDAQNNYVTGMDAMPCAAWLNVSAVSWSVVTRLDSEAVFLGGGGAGVVAVGSWSPLRMVARGDRVVVSAGPVLLASFNSTAAPGPAAPAAGFVSLGAGVFGAQPLFRALQVNATTVCSSPPALNSSVFVEACAAGSAGQSFELIRGVGRTQDTVQVFVGSANACLQVDDAAAPDYQGYPRARRVFLAACSSADGQQFSHESGATTDGNSLKSGPLQGVDGVVLGAKGNSDADDTEIIGFPYQGGSNNYWSFDASAGSSSFLSTFGGYCLTFCSKI